jgi:hypothetical protein
MQNLLVEVKAIRRCDGGHTCNLVVNGRRVAFIAPGILEWSSFSKRTDVLAWFAQKNNIKRKELEPMVLGQGWESKIPDHKLDDAKDELTETAVLEWVSLHVMAYEVAQRCKKTVMTIGRDGEILDWRIPPSNAANAGLDQSCIEKTGSILLNGCSATEIVSLLESKRKVLPQTAEAA